MLRRPDYTQVWLSYDFLIEQAKSGRAFTVPDLMKATGWSRDNCRTNLSKRMSEFVERLRPGTYRALPIINRVRKADYARLFSQKNLLFGVYDLWLYPDLVIYDFLMPLTREDRLRESLDRLFYTDRIAQRLREIGPERIRRRFLAQEHETDDELVGRVARLAGEAFVGYSISHVNGRFRMHEPMDAKAAAAIAHNEQGYLADETTAVVRFIMRCSATACKQPPESDQLDLDLEDDPDMEAQAQAAVEQERKRTQWLFRQVFAESVVMTVNYEEEIWLLEQGPHMRLWVWKRRSPDAEADDPTA
ncbi:hypothetical protein LLH23_10250 [bacterium]|nr:hypothetical protein [bacterium]